MVVVGVAHAQAAAEVVDGELAKRGDPRDRLRERLDVEDLGADVHVQAPHAQARAARDPPDQLDAAAGASPNFEPSSGQHAGVIGARHPPMRSTPSPATSLLGGNRDSRASTA